MSPQTQEINFGNEEKAIITVDNPTFRVWKNADVIWDLSSCSEKNQKKALESFTEILKAKLGKREISPGFHLDVTP